MNYSDDEVSLIEYKEAITQYYDYYKAFYDVFSLMEIRERIATIKDGVVIEIRNKEDGHNTPHIHAKYQGDNVSISLIDGSILAGNIPRKNQIAAQKWVLSNLEGLREQWNDKHVRISFPNLGTAKKPECL